MSETIEPSRSATSSRRIETVPSARVIDLERRSSGTLNITIRNLEESLATLPPDDPIHKQVKPHLEEAYALLGRMDRGDVTDAISILDGARRLSKIFESFDRDIRLRKVRTEPAAPAPVEQAIKYGNQRKEDEQGIRQRYDSLIQKRLQLQQELDSWRTFFRRGEVQRSLQLVNQDVAKYEKKFPFVLTARDFANPTIRQQESKYQAQRVVTGSSAERQDALNKAVAVHRADTALELQRKELRVLKSPVSPEVHRKDSLLKYNELQQLLHNPPSRGQNYDQWYRKCTQAEGYLAVYSKLGAVEQSQTAKYWKDKIAVLESIKPILFGRTEWQKQYQHAQEERTYELHRARAAQLRTQQRAA